MRDSYLALDDQLTGCSELTDSISNQHYFEHAHVKLYVIVISCLEHFEDFQSQIRNIPQFLIARNLVYVVLSKSLCRVLLIAIR